MADQKISDLTAIDQSAQVPADTYIPLYHVGGAPLNPRMNMTNVRVGSVFYVGLSGAAVRMNASSDGVLVLQNNTPGGFGRLCLGGTTASFPSLKRSGAELQVRLADDVTGFADLKASCFIANDGTAAAPTLTFTSDPNTGIYSAAADQIGLTTGGTVRATLSTSALTMTVPVAIADGTVGAPSLAFASSPTTGLYRSAANEIAFATAGVQRLTIGATGTSTFIGGTVTANTPPLSISQTWNNVATTFNGVLLNVTDTASATASTLLDLQVGGVSKFAVTKGGTLNVYNTYTDASNYERGVFKWSSNVLQIGTEAAGTGTARTLSLIVGGTSRVSIANAASGVILTLNAETNTGIGTPGSGHVSLYNSGLEVFRCAAGSVNYSYAGHLGLGTSVLLSGTHNAVANLMSVGAASGTGAQRLEIYNTWSNATQNERGVLDWKAITNVFSIGTEKGSVVGTARDMAFITDATERLRINATTGNITLADAIDIQVNTTTGTKIGTATSQKLGFWNVTPVIQPASANQASITDSTGGTPGSSLVDVTATPTQAAINNNFATVNVLLLAIRTALVNSGIMKGSA